MAYDIDPKQALHGYICLFGTLLSYSPFTFLFNRHFYSYLFFPLLTRLISIVVVVSVWDMLSNVLAHKQGT